MSNNFSSCFNWLLILLIYVQWQTVVSSFLHIVHFLYIVFYKHIQWKALHILSDYAIYLLLLVIVCWLFFYLHVKLECYMLTSCFGYTKEIWYSTVCNQHLVEMRRHWPFVNKICVGWKNSGTCTRKPFQTFWMKCIVKWLYNAHPCVANWYRFK